jgi:hypothetical protein
MFVSVTRLRVRSFRYLPAFSWMTTLARRQAARAAGFAGGRLLLDSHLTFWTLTGWKDEQAMKAFRGHGAHARVMPLLAGWCDEGAYAHWIADGDDLPLWPEAYEHLVKDGRLSRVSHPSPSHQARQFAQPRLRPLIGRDFGPRVTGH